MSLKENIDMVKEELNSEEKFFEKAVMTERFVKKYKKVLIGAVVVVMAVVIGDVAYNINKQNRITSANETLAQLQKNPNDTAALARLETLSPQLHDVWLYAQGIANQNAAELAKLHNTSALVIPDTATYESAQLEADTNKLQAYAAKQDAIYKDLAHVLEAVLFIEQNKIDAAHEQLSMVAMGSPLSEVANALMHYGVK